MRVELCTSRLNPPFPKAYLNEKRKDREPNLIANITLLDGYSNKHKIGKKPPSEYISKFAVENDSIDETLNSHLIYNASLFGVNDDDYDRFIRFRSEAISISLNEKLNPNIP
jgi:hypothetical protein